MRTVNNSIEIREVLIKIRKKNGKSRRHVGNPTEASFKFLKENTNN